MGESWAVSNGISGGGSMPIRSGGIGHDILRRRGHVVGDVENAAQLAIREMPQRARYVVDMDAVEDLSGLDQPLGRAALRD